jgi:hypothetical protein
MSTPPKTRLSLHPVTPEEALASLIQVKPEGKKPSQKPTAARKASKKKGKQK